MNELLSLAPDKVRQMRDSGLLDDNQVADYVVGVKKRDRGIHSLSIKEVRHGVNRGVLSTQEAANYIDRAKNPLSYNMKDTGRGVVHGLMDFGEEVAEAADALATWMGGAALETDPFSLEEAETNEFDLLDKGMNLVRDATPVEEPTTGYGNFARVTTEFAASTYSMGKITKVFSGMKGFQAMKESGKAGKLVGNFIEGHLKYYLGEQIAFGPNDPRLSDMVTGVPGLGIVADYLKSDPNDGEWEGRMKMAAESALIDVGMHGLSRVVGVFFKHLKNRFWKQAGNKPDEVAALVDDAVQADKKTTALQENHMNPKKFEEEEIVPHRTNIEEDTVYIGERPEIEQRLEVPTVSKLTTEDTHQLTEDILRAGSKADDFYIGKGFLKNFNNIESVNDAFRIMNAVAHRLIKSGEIDKFTQGVQTHGMTKFKAEKYQAKLMRQAGKIGEVTGTDPQQVFNSFIHKSMKQDFDTMKNLHAKMLAYDKFVIWYEEQIARWSREIMENTDPNFDRIKAYNDVYTHMQYLWEIEGLTKGITTETARALQSRRVMRSAMDGMTPQQWDEIKNLHGNKLEKIVTTYAKESDRLVRHRMIRTAGRTKLERLAKFAVEWRQAALVSNPVSQIRNVAGNTSALTFEAAARTFAGMGMGLAKGDQYFTQAYKYWYGMYEGFKRALRVTPEIRTSFSKGELRRAYRLFKEELAKAPHETELGTVYRTWYTGTTVTDYLMKQADEQLQPFESSLAKIPGGIGTVLQVPFKMLSTVDEFFKSLSYQAEMHYRAYGKVIDEIPELTGKTAMEGKSLKEIMEHRYHRLVEEPDDLLQQQAILHSRDITFTNELGKGGRALNSALNSPIGAPVKLMAVPFYSVAVNLMKFSAYRTFGMFSRNWWKQFRKGGTDRMLAMTQLGMGWSIMGLGAGLYYGGMLTGTSPMNQKWAWRNAQVQEYSFRRPGSNKWVNYAGFEPFGSMFGIAADFFTLVDDIQINDRELSERMTMMMAMFAENVSNKTFMKGMADFIQILTNPERMNIERYMQQFTATMAPYSTALQQLQRTIDPQLKDMRRWIDTVWKNVDAGKMLPYRHAVYGHTMDREPNALLFLRKMKQTDDPAMWDMLRTGANVRPPRRKRKLPTGVDHKMTPEEYDEYMQIIEALPLKQVLNTIATNSQFLNVNDHETRAEVYRSIVREFRAAAWAIFLSKNQNLVKDSIPELQARAEAIAGRGFRPDKDTAAYHWINRLGG